MKTYFLAFAIVAVVLTTADFTTAFMLGNKGDAPGVSGNTILVEKDQTNLDTVDHLEVFDNDKIQLCWSYPIVPGFIPDKVEAKATGGLKFIETRNLIRPGVVGDGILAAEFIAKKHGPSSATLLVTCVDEQNQTKIISVSCEVEVTKRQ